MYEFRQPDCNLPVLRLSLDTEATPSVRQAAFTARYQHGMASGRIALNDSGIGQPDSGRFHQWDIHPVCGAAEHTKAKVVVPVLRRVPVAVRRTAVPGVVVPAAAPVHPVRAPWPLTGSPSNTR